MNLKNWIKKTFLITYILCIYFLPFHFSQITSSLFIVLCAWWEYLHLWTSERQRESVLHSTTRGRFWNAKKKKKAHLQNGSKSNFLCATDRLVVLREVGEAHAWWKEADCVTISLSTITVFSSFHFLKTQTSFFCHLQVDPGKKKPKNKQTAKKTSRWDFVTLLYVCH